MRIFIIVQARMTSSRLPGKVLKEVLEKPLLAYQLERLKRTERPIIVATTTNQTDDPIIALCQQMKVQTFRGDEHDVLGRYYEAADRVHADTIIRITGDCPLVDSNIIEKITRYYLEHDNAYVSNTLKRSYPRGMDVEVFSMDLLHQAHLNAKFPFEREHVTPYIYTHFPTGHVISRTDSSHYRLTVDEEEDFYLIKKILEDLYPTKPEFTLEDILTLLREKPELAKINQHIEQKSHATWTQTLVNEPSLL